MRQSGGVQFEVPAVDAQNLKLQWRPFRDILDDFMEVISRICVCVIVTYQAKSQFESGKGRSNMMHVAELFDKMVEEDCYRTSPFNAKLSESRKPAEGY